MRRFLRNNCLSLVLLGFFLLSLAGQSLTGHQHHNEEQTEHGGSTVTYAQYIASPAFLEATMENWESEFLQMFAFVVLTVFLFQKGSAESKDPEKKEPVDEDPRRKRNDPKAPGPVRRGGLALKLYENSLSLAFLALFLFSFVLHAVGGAGDYNEEQSLHGTAQQVSTLQYMGTSRFWFESFQNWQSEFLAIASMVLLSIFLRQRGSPESKPVASPHDQTGSG